MRRRMIAGGFLACVLLTCTGACLLVFQFRLFNGCVIGGCAPPRTFRPTDLSLPTNLFPVSAWTIGMQPVSLEDLSEIGHGSQTVNWSPPGSGALYDVIRCLTHEMASERYASEKSLFSEGEPGNRAPWPSPAWVTYRSPKASEFHVACGTFIAYKCAMVARYEEYVVRFWSDMDPPMTEQRFEEIVRFIDTQLSERLYH